MWEIKFCDSVYPHMNLKALHCTKYSFENVMGIPWQSTGQDSELPLPGTQFKIWSEKLRSYKPRCMAAKKENDSEGKC